ncbi:hypothetical protein HaLaN_29339, partial [Haematococcus lacustris]
MGGSDTYSRPRNAYATLNKPCRTSAERDLSCLSGKLSFESTARPAAVGTSLYAAKDGAARMASAACIATREGHPAVACIKLLLERRIIASGQTNVEPAGHIGQEGGCNPFHDNDCDK